MRFSDTDPFAGLAYSYVVDSAQPSSISYAWTLGTPVASLLVASALAGALLAALAALLAVRVGRGADLRAALRVSEWAALAALLLVSTFGVYLAADPSLPSVLLLAAHPLSCLWGVGAVSRLRYRVKRGLGLSTLAQGVARFPLAEVTVATFLWYLPPVLGGTYQYLQDPRSEDPAGGSAALAVPTSLFLGIKTWFAGSFRRDTGLLLHAAAFASLLLSAPGLLLHFLGSLPWEAVSKDRVRLSLLFAFAPLALVLELLLSYAGHPNVRFHLHRGTRLTLVVRVDALRSVILLATGAPSGSNRSLFKFLTRTEGGPEGRVRADFYRSPVPPFPRRLSGPGRRG